MRLPRRPRFCRPRCSHSGLECTSRAARTGRFRGRPVQAPGLGDDPAGTQRSTVTDLSPHPSRARPLPWTRTGPSTPVGRTPGSGRRARQARGSGPVSAHSARQARIRWIEEPPAPWAATARRPGQVGSRFSRGGRGLTDGMKAAPLSAKHRLIMLHHRLGEPAGPKTGPANDVWAMAEMNLSLVLPGHRTCSLRDSWDPVE